MQISTELIGLKNTFFFFFFFLSFFFFFFLSQLSYLLNPGSLLTRFSSVAIEINSSHGKFSLIAIELKLDRNVS